MTPDELAAAGLRLDVSGALATITLDRPQVRNAQTPTMWRALAAIGESLGDEIRVVVVQGEGPTFSAGLDRSLLDPKTVPEGMESVADLFAMTPEGMTSTIDAYQQGFTFLRDPRWMSIAAVRGYAVGAGFQLALSCDVRVVTEDAQFCMKESVLGLVPDLTGTQPLVECVGYSRALEICVSARMVPAEEAVRIGLAHSSVPAEELDATVAGLVTAFTTPMVGAVRETKALLLGVGQRSLDEQRRLEREAQLRRFTELGPLLGITQKTS